MKYLNDSLISLQYIIEHECKEAKKVILVDKNTKQHCLPILINKIKALETAHIITIEPGEKSKNNYTVDYILRHLIDIGADKTTVFLSVGGGMVSDIGGFVSAIYYRGICHIEVPTTTMAMVDAAIGGKNGVNFNSLKNQIGTITKPFYTCCYLPFLKTLDDRNIANGAAEMIKLALVADKDLWNKMKTMTPLEIGQNEKLMEACIELKEAIVSEDFYDTEKRQILNFGHNFAHAIEAFAMSINFDIQHGEAVARGIYYETMLSKNILGFSNTQYDEVINYIQKHFVVSRTINQYLQLLDYLRFDKKNRFGTYRFTLLKEIGCPQTNVLVSEADIATLLLSLQTNINI
ncbi:MAG: 3-dehydroquinate synthase [Bacteroidales bacterium]|jgi:3-dehydroquinate synthase|nr:3-dehydroquinate synthase [Bacteroidales bacterium]